MNTANLEQQVREHVQAANYQPVKPKVIARQLKIPEDRFPELRRTIKKLIKRGDLVYGPKHRVMPTARKTSQNGPTGTFQRHPDGYGFVRMPRNEDGTQNPDIYIPRSKTEDAATGDQVRIRIKSSSRGNKSRTSGEILEIVKRRSYRFVGTYQESGQRGSVLVDGTIFAKPIPVEDPSAKRIQVGDKVAIEVVQFPSKTQAGQAVVLEVLGPQGTPEVDTRSIIYQYNLPTDFPEAVMQDARQQAERFDETITGTRQDLTELTVLTIDPADARDFDDAISIEKLKNGHWLLYVHIADVSHFIPVGSQLDQEARQRGTSVYLPDVVLPMLPETISNHLASLQPDCVRYALTAIIEWTAEGQRVSTDLQRTAIRSDRRFTYREVDQFLANPNPWENKLSPEVFELLSRMAQFARILRKRRMDGGSLELTLPAIKIDLDSKGQVEGAHAEEQTESHQIIEEFMLAANEAVAQWLTDREVLFLRRQHQSPSAEKLATLTSFLQDLGWDVKDIQSRFEIRRVLQEAAGSPQEYAINLAVLKSMQKAIYSPEESGHYALNSEHYCHFTSPIRRYPDLEIHRLIEMINRGKKPPTDLATIQSLGDHCSEREQVAEAAERELIKLKLLGYLSQHIGMTMEAVITGVEDFGLFVQGLELPADGLVHITTLREDHYKHDPQTHTLTGHRQGNQFRLGDKVQVEVTNVDLNRRQLDFKIVQRLNSATPNKSSSNRPSPRSKSATRKGKQQGFRSQKTQNSSSPRKKKKKPADPNKDSRKKKHTGKKKTGKKNTGKKKTGKKHTGKKKTGKKRHAGKKKQSGNKKRRRSQ